MRYATRRSRPTPVGITRNGPEAAEGTVVRTASGGRGTTTVITLSTTRSTDQLAQSPLGTLYPDVDWEAMFRKSGEMVSEPYDWSTDIAGITSPTLLIFADADMMYPEHIVEFYRLLGGGTRDAGLDGSLRPTANQLAIIPGTTHYNLPQVATESMAHFANAFLAG